MIFKAPNYERVYFEDKYLVTGHLPTRAIHGAKSDEMILSASIPIRMSLQKIRMDEKIKVMTNSKEKEEEKTLQYYNDNALNFVENTINADMSEARNKFISYLSEKALILDWGCGSGRDSLAFKEAGYQIEATDASEELCQLASEKLGQEVSCETFDELDAKEKYDGIWACASLLHLEKDYIPGTFEIACKALKPGGVMYASFKYGDFEGERNGRYFTDMTEERFAKSIRKIKHFELVEQWITEDVRNDRNEKWLNVIFTKA